MGFPFKRNLTLPTVGSLLLALAVIAVYGGTLQVPWYFDDIHSIVENPAIRQFDLTWRSLLTSPRSLVNWTFALNYRWGGLEVQGYHLVNIGIHLLTSLLVFNILLRILKDRQILALFGALLFAVHPLQTQSVTYLVQRMTSLSGLCFFLAIALFLQARSLLAKKVTFFAPRHLLYYGCALLAGALAALIKQNAVTLPLVLALFLWLHPEEGATAIHTWRKKTLYLLPFILAPLALGLQQVILPLFAGKQQLANMGMAQTLSTLHQPTPLQYLFTEFSVLWLYLKLFILPVGQALDYSYPVTEKLWTLRNLLAGAGLLGLAGLAWWLRRQRPLISLGIYWFFITLAVESTLIPLDPVFEHRLYVPLFGLVLIVLDLWSRLSRPRWQLGSGCAILLILSLLAWQRNQLWNDPIAFVEDNLRRAPHSERVITDLAKRYMDVGRNTEAEGLLERAMTINPNFELTYINLSKIYADRGEYNRARDLLLAAANRFVKSVKYLDNLGSILDLTGEPVQAERILLQGLALDPLYANLYLNLGALYARQGRWDEATNFYRQSLNRFPETALLCYNYGVALYSQELYAEARHQFRRAYELNPDDADSLYNLGFVSLKLGDHAATAALLRPLYALDVKKARSLEEELAISKQQRP